MVSSGRSSAEMASTFGSIGVLTQPSDSSPLKADEDFGYCLHPADLATNKVLALVGRSEIRDFLDILQLDREYLSLGVSSGQLVAKTRDSRPCKSLI